MKLEYGAKRKLSFSPKPSLWIQFVRGTNLKRIEFHDVMTDFLKKPIGPELTFSQTFKYLNCESNSLQKRP